MKIQELDVSLKLVGEELELIEGKTMLGPVRLGTELATEIADVGYFKIASGNHNSKSPQYIH
jgi:hypothetical protein